MKRILILTAGFGEGHNSAARGLRAGLLQAAGDGGVQVEVHDLFSETYGAPNDWACRLYLHVIDQWPRLWGRIYRGLDRQQKFSGKFGIFFALKRNFHALLERLNPDVIVSVYPAYPHMLDEMLGPADERSPRRVVVVTDSITVNAIWYRCSADFFLLPNEESAASIRAEGVPPEKTRTFGFPVSPEFGAGSPEQIEPSAGGRPRVLYLVNARKEDAPQLVQALAGIRDIELTVAVGRNRRLLRQIAEIRKTSPPFDLVGWSDEMPRLLRTAHLLISKAGGATVQEAIAARRPMIVNHVVPGQEEGNARLIAQTHSGLIAPDAPAVVDAVKRAFAGDAALWREWHRNITALSRPAAAVDTARFLLSL